MIVIHFFSSHAVVFTRMLEQENRWLLPRIPSPCVFDVETYFYLLIDLYNISVIDRSPSPGENILPPTGKHFKRIPRARYPGYQSFFLCLGMLRCRPQHENFTYLKFCFSMLPVFIHEAYTETIIVHFLSDLKRP